MDPDEFEIHISDNESPFPENNIAEKPSEINQPHKNEMDLLRASLSDVVLTQSLQLSERNIDFEDGDQIFIKDSALNTNSSHTQEPDALMAASPTMAEPEPSSVSALSQPKEAALEDIAADFEDAVDPPLLTSTLKAANEDSDDEFDFDLPSSKPDKGKNVRFSGEFGCEEPAKEAGDTAESQKEGNKPEGVEKPVQQAVVSPPVVPHVGEKGDMKAVVVSMKPESGEAVPQDIAIKQEQDEEEREDRRHIITSSAADWDNVETVEAGYSDAQTGAESMTSLPPLQAFSDIWQHFRAMDHSAVKDKIQVTTEKKGFSAIVSRLFGPPKMHKDLHGDRELVFCIAATAFDNGDSEHTQSLQTIYRVLTGSRFNCPRYGSHWEEIGFQGRDPATDLRGAGMLALVQLVYFLQDDSTAQLARDLYKLSLHPTQNFPFCVMCINISRITVQALRDGVLNRECNSQKKVMAVVNQFYAGTLLFLYRVWQHGKTISDSGFVIRDVENRAKKQSKEVFKDLQAYITSQKASAESSAMSAFGSSSSRDPKGSGKKDENVNFFSVVKSETKTAAELY